MLVYGRPRRCYFSLVEYTSLTLVPRNNNPFRRTGLTTILINEERFDLVLSWAWTVLNYKLSFLHCRDIHLLQDILSDTIWWPHLYLGRFTYWLISNTVEIPCWTRAKLIWSLISDLKNSSVFAKFYVKAKLLKI